MARLSWISWLLLLCLGLLAFWTGATVFSLWMMAPALKKAIATAFEQAAPIILAEVIISLYWMVILEIVIAAVIWSTRGPIMVLAWAAVLYAYWQQGG
jgi:hypothetical protein